MIIYSTEGNKIIIKLVFKIENIDNNENLNEIIANGLINLAKQVEENKIKIYNSKEIGVF